MSSSILCQNNVTFVMELTMSFFAFKNLDEFLLCSDKNLGGLSLDVSVCVGMLVCMRVYLVIKFSAESLFYTFVEKSIIESSFKSM